MPFNDPRFTWQTLESFLCHFLNCQPQLGRFAGETSEKIKVLSSRKIGIPGGRQFGVEIEAKMSNGETWVFQCKHYIKTKWTRKHTERAVKKVTYTADRFFLVITQEVGEEARNPVKDLEAWNLWDVRQISSLFLDNKDLTEQEKMRLLRTHFGREWCNDLLGKCEEVPYLLPDPYFLPFLDENRIFHHGYPWVEIPELESSFKRFLRNKNQRLFILSGIGGSGKSRFLREISGRKFLGKQTKWNPVFLLRIPEDIEEKLSDLPRPTILILDEAEKESNYRRLFSWALRAESVKLVVGSRPLTVKQLRDAAIASYIESDQIEVGKMPDKLSEANAVKLADSILGNVEINRFELVEACSRHPLLIVAVCYLIRSNQLDSRYLVDSQNLRDDVYGKIIHDICPPTSESSRLRRLLNLMALLSPLQFEDEVRDSLMKLLKVDRTELNDLLSKLLEHGLVVERSRDQFRIYPDVLGEFILFDACFRDNLRSTDFAEQYMDAFPRHFPNMMRNIANTQWAAMRRGTPDDIFRPFFDAVKKRYGESDDKSRFGLIEEWSKIAGYHPQYTLDLVELMLEISGKDPGDPDDIHAPHFRKFALQEIPGLLGAVAEQHEDLVEVVLDKYWECIQWDKETYPAFREDLFNKVSDLFDAGDYPYSTCLKALGWLDNKLGDSAFMGWLESSGARLVGLLGKALELGGSAGERFSKHTFTITRFRRGLESVMPIRRSVQGILKKLIESGNDALKSDCLRVISKGIDYYSRHVENGIPEWASGDLDEWFDLAKAAVTTSGNPALVSILQSYLRRDIDQAESEAVRRKFVAFKDQLPPSFESKIIGFVHSDYVNWFYPRTNSGPTPDSNLRNAVRKMERKFNSPVKLIGFLNGIEEQMGKCRLKPLWFAFLAELSAANPELAGATALKFVGTKGPEGVRSKSSSLLDSLQCRDSGARDDFIKKCLDSGDDYSVEAMMMGLLSWAKQKELTEFQQETLKHLCQSQSLEIWRYLISIANLRSMGYEKSRRHIHERIPRKLAAGELTDIILNGLYPPFEDEELLEKILSKIVTADFQKSVQFEPTFTRLSQEHPEVMADFFEQRIDRLKSADEPAGFPTFPYGFYPKIELDGSDPKTIDRLERLFGKSNSEDEDGYIHDYLRLLSFLRFNVPDFLEKFILEKLTDADEMDEVNPILHFLNEAFLLLIKHPKIARALLKKLKELLDASPYNEERSRLIISVAWRRRDIVAGKKTKRDDIIRDPLKQLLTQYESDPNLFPFYSEMLDAEEEANRRLIGPRTPHPVN